MTRPQWLKLSPPRSRHANDDELREELHESLLACCKQLLDQGDRLVKVAGKPAPPPKALRVLAADLRATASQLEDAANLIECRKRGRPM